MSIRLRSDAVLIALIALVVCGVTATTAQAQSTAVRYERIAQREKTARASATVTATTLRTIAKSYENFTRAHYLSGYADNALWQAAGLYDTAYARSKDARDRDAVVRLLTWLKKEYPTGTLAKQADARLQALAPERPRDAKPAAQVPAPAPASPPSQSPAPAQQPAQPNAQTSLPARQPAPPKPETTDTAPPRPAPEPVVATTPLAPVKPAPAAPTVASGISVKTINHSALPKGDRLVLEFSAEAVYASSRTSNPDRVFIDLPDAGAAQVLIDQAGKITGTLIKTTSVIRNANGTLRLILQLNGQPRYSTFPLYDPFRLVIDLESDAPSGTLSPRVPAAVVAKSVVRDAIVLASATPVDTSVPDATVRNVPVSPAATKSGGYSLARQLGLGVSRIVIDPGHGGHDPGASANGVTEAGLVLDVALRLEALLEDQEGVDVVLTRRTDDYVALEQRTAIANRESADMFISIHANSSPQKNTSGVETFFLDFSSNPHAQAVAARENATSTQNMRVLPELVKTIALTNKMQESRELAAVVQSSLVQRLKSKDAGARDLGVKQAPFLVLIGAQMPSVLAEVSFLTNRAEATLLKQGAYRQRIAQALADAILKYQGTLKRVTTVAARTTH